MVEIKGAVNISNAVSIALFRIMQEALTNVVRHANASKVELRLWKEDDLACLEIADNGWGITDEELQSKDSIGLLGMRERAYALGGTVDIIGRIGAGTTVTIRIPDKG
jgi:signal transduction histidine kinase